MKHLKLYEFFIGELADDIFGLSLDVSFILPSGDIKKDEKFLFKNLDSLGIQYEYIQGSVVTSRDSRIYSKVISLKIFTGQTLEKFYESFPIKTKNLMYKPHHRSVALTDNKASYELYLIDGKLWRFKE